LINTEDLSALPASKLQLIINITNELLDHAESLYDEYTANISQQTTDYTNKHKLWYDAHVERLDAWDALKNAPEYGSSLTTKETLRLANESMALALQNYSTYNKSLATSDAQTILDSLHEIKTYVLKLKTGTKSPTVTPTATPTVHPTRSPTPPTPYPTVTATNPPTSTATNPPTSTAINPPPVMATNAPN